MEWTIRVNETKQYALIVTKGIADKEGSLAMVKSIMAALGQTKITRILIDHRNLDKVSGEILDVYHRPREFDEIGVPKTIKIAEIVRPEHRIFFRFLETVCINRGYSFSVFQEEKAALDWLLES